jgi:multiple sugar transport system permease protein
MSSTQHVLAAGPRVSVKGPRQTLGRRNLRASDLRWAIAFVVPYAAVFLAFVVYPFGYALWMASKPSLYANLISDRLYLPTVVNTLLFVGLSVNVKMFLALLLSGFFLRPRWWIKALLAVYILPWAIPAAQARISFHWMLIGEQGLVDGVLSALFGIDGPLWFNHRWLGLGSNIVAYIWKWMPFWTLIFLAARLTIPRDIYDAAEVDGATGIRRFVHVTFPLLANLYLICARCSPPSGHSATLRRFILSRVGGHRAPASCRSCAAHLLSRPTTRVTPASAFHGVTESSTLPDVKFPLYAPPAGRRDGFVHQSLANF